MSAEREVLVVEDEAVIRGALKRLPDGRGCRASEAASARESLDRFNVNHFGIAIGDLELPGAPGSDPIRRTSAPAPIVTGCSSIRSAIDSMKLGISRKCLWERRQRQGIPRGKRHSA